MENKEEKLERDRKYSVEWRKNNPDKIKAYLERSKERRAKVRDVYYEKNREHIIHQINNKKRKDGWACDKTDERRRDGLVRKKTRMEFPLNGNKCKHCSSLAVHRHHTTKPLEFDKFDYLCKNHHDKAHNKKNYSFVELDDE